MSADASVGAIHPGSLEFVRALKKELPSAIKTIQQGGISAVDLPQASIGPGMAIFSRYSRVIEAGGTPMTVGSALQLINQTLDEVLDEQETEFDPETRWCRAWFEQFGTGDGPFGTAESLSKAKNTATKTLESQGLIISRGGKVRLVSTQDMPTSWDPSSGSRISIWKAAHELIGVLRREGEQAAATLLRRIGGIGDPARDLAYRLYSICERKGWSKEGIEYNALVVAWPEITRLRSSGIEQFGTTEAV